MGKGTVNFCGRWKLFRITDLLKRDLKDERGQEQGEWAACTIAEEHEGSCSEEVALRCPIQLNSA